MRTLASVPTRRYQNARTDIGAKLNDDIDAGRYEAAIALARSELARDDRLHIALSLGKALVLAGKCDEASRTLHDVVERALRRGDTPSAAAALEWLSWLAFGDLDGKGSQSVSERMLSLEMPATSPEAFRIHVSKATLSIQLGDPATAARIVEEAEQESRDADIGSFEQYLCVKSDLLSALGRPAEALNYARLSADISLKRGDLFLRWRSLTYLSYLLSANGMLADAFETYLAAETAASDASLTWEVTLTRARAAWTALLLGRATIAHELIESCFEVPYDRPWMMATRAFAGIFIAQACGDERLLARAADVKLLEAVFASADHYTIGPVAAAFLQYYHHAGKSAEFQALLELAISRLRSPDCGWTIFPLVAAHGSDSAIRRATELLGRYPHEHRVAEAFRQYFAALLAARRGNSVVCDRHSGEAQLLFEDFGCDYYATRCLELAGRSGEAQRRYQLMGAAGDARRIGRPRGPRGRPRRSYEASRERREILQLLLAGLTSAAIAERLGVSQRTIKSRVSEIYDFEGVRSRSELLTLYATANPSPYGESNRPSADPR